MIKFFLFFSFFQFICSQRIKGRNFGDGTNVGYSNLNADTPIELGTFHVSKSGKLTLPEDSLLEDAKTHH